METTTLQTGEKSDTMEKGKDETENPMEEEQNESEVMIPAKFSGGNSSDVFKKPQLIIGPRRGKAVGKVRSLEYKPPEQPTKTDEKDEDPKDDIAETDSAKEDTNDSSETDSNIIVKNIETSSTISPAQKMKESSIPLPYKEPNWSGIPNEAYSFEVLKSGKILENVVLNTKSFYVFGRLSTCDIRLAHPTISRYHAVLQYRSEESENYPIGFYVYDLGSTHGTFLNKSHIKANMYVRVQVGHILKLGLSTRLFLLQGPEQDMEEESELTVTQLKEKRQKELAAKELEEFEYQQQEEERLKREEEQGIDWGMSEDADEDTDIAENPFAATQNEELYINDPKKTLRGWFEREGYELEYDVEEKGFGQFLCRVELPIENARGSSMMAEALVKGKKKEAVVQCALEACRLLDRYGLLRQATHESKKRKAKDWEAEDYYDSDEDTFLDRTGTVEKKRQQRMRAAGKKDPEDVVETYDSLLKKHNEILLQLKDLEIELQNASAIVNSSSHKENDNLDDEEDALDAFMMKLSTPTADKKLVTEIKSRLSALKLEEIRLRKLVNIARPANLPELRPPEETHVPVNSSAASKKALPLVGMRRKVNSRPKQINITNIPSDSVTPKINQEQEEEDDEEDERENVNNAAKDSRMSYSNIKDIVTSKQPEEQEKPSHLLHEDEKEIMEIKTTENLQTVTQKPKILGPAMLPPPKIRSETVQSTHAESSQDDKVEKEADRKRNRNKRRIQQRNEKAIRQKSDYDPSDPDYSVWVPPGDQTGDGRTKLNDKYGY